MTVAANERRMAGEERRAGFDAVLVITAVLLICIGIVFVTSASTAIAARETGNAFHFGEKQMVFALLGFVAALVAMAIPMAFWQKLSPMLLFAALGMLTLVLIPGFGREVNGSIRWLVLGPFRIAQVSEPARIFMILFVADYLARRQDEVRYTFKGFAKPMALTAVACVLLLAEPDFGATTVLMATVLGMLFIGGARLRDFMLLFGGAVLSLATLAISSPYRLQRLTGFLDPWADPYDSGFQLTQSLIAIGRGEWFGVGLGAGVQKLFYLPEAHTDFVFAVIAEELGLLGVGFVIGLYVLLFIRIFRVARRAAASGRLFGAYTAFGVGTWIGMQAMINLGVNMGVLPTKGLTLPLISAGGSSLLVTCAAIGLVLRIGYETERGTADVWQRKEQPQGVPA